MCTGEERARGTSGTAPRCFSSRAGEQALEMLWFVSRSHQVTIPALLGFTAQSKSTLLPSKPNVCYFWFSACSIELQSRAASF